MIKLLRFVVLPVLVLGLALLLAVAVVRSRPEVTKESIQDPGTLVEVTTVHRVPRRFDLEAQGIVLAARTVIVQPQVSGRISSVATGLSPGRLLKKGDHLFSIERADFELAVERQEAALAEIEAQLDLERGRQRVALREWELFQDEIDEAQKQASLALREPQLRAAEAMVATAMTRLAQAELDLARTRVTSPFNAFVRAESIEEGQIVGPQSQTMTLIGTDNFWVRAAVPVDQLDAIRIPGLGGDTHGSPARVRLDPQSDSWRQGEVVQLLGDLDTAGRMARVLIDIPDPVILGRKEPMERSRLLLDSYVDVLIEGAETRELFDLPREWLHDGSTVWLYDGGQLEVREVDIVWRFEETVCVDGGLEEGELIITSRIATPLQGMKLRHEWEPLDAQPLIRSRSLELGAPEAERPSEEPSIDTELDTRRSGLDFEPSLANATSDRQILELSTDVTEDEVLVRLSSGGELAFYSFLLRDPHRFVVDLDGVMSINESIAVSGGPVRQVRRAQFSLDPHPVARVVVDLETRTEPVIEAGPGWITLRFATSRRTGG